MQQQPERNDMLPPALEKVSQELKRASSERSDVLAKDIKDRQRAMLIEHAEKTLMPKDVSEKNAITQEKTSKAPFFAWGGFALAGALAVFAFFVVTKDLPTGEKAIRALHISAAHAQDAFSLSAEKQDAQGVDTESAFKIESKIVIQEQDLKDALRISPPIQYELEKTNDNEYRILPKEALEEGTVYKVSIATVVDESMPIAREFSWAMQTKETFKMVSSIPATGASNVPMNTGIEFKFTQSGFEAPTGSQFTITPAVKGRFEIYGRTLAFIPTEPLTLGTLYEVRLEKTFAPTGSEEHMDEDAVIRFETSTNKPGEYRRQIRAEVPETVYSASNKDVTIDLGYRDDKLNAIKVSGYAITQDVAKSLMEQKLSVPGFAYATKESNDPYEKANKTLSFDLEANVTNNKLGSPEIVLPKIDKGFYLVRFEPKDVENSKASWTLLQVADIAAYTTVDKDGIYVWAINSVTNRPLGALPIQKDHERVITDETGVARLATPSSFTDTTRSLGQAMPFALLTLGDGKDAIVIALQQSYYSYLDFVRPGYPTTIHNRTMAFIRAERALYRTSDEMKVFGIARDREAKVGLHDVTVRITKGDQLYDLRTGGLKVYQEVQATPDATGRFTADLKWSDLAQGNYNVEVVRDGNEVIATQGVEVREFIKPSYSIEALPEQDRYYMGDTVTAPVRARFFDGTPIANTTLQVDVEATGMTYHGQVITDLNGNATVQIPTQYVACDAITPKDTDSCNQNVTAFVYIRPTVGEEADQETMFTVELYRSRVGINLDVDIVDTAASGTISVWANDLQSPNLGRDRKLSQAVKVTAYPKYYVKKENGSYYNPITKLNEPTYTYEQLNDDPIVLSLVTNTNGIATFKTEMRADRHYSFYVEALDEKGQVARDERYISRMYDTSYPDRLDNVYPELRFSAPQRQYMIDGEMRDAGYELNEEITATYHMGNDPLDTANTPGVLFVIASRGIVKTTVQNSPKLDFRLEERLTPNAQIIAVTFRDGAFETVRGGVSYASVNNELTFDIKPQKATYAPGENVTVDISAKRKTTGEPVSDVVMSYAAVDKALLALGGGSYINPLQQMYGWVADEILIESKTHAERFGPGGAEMGGGGAMLAKSDIRTNLKDVAISGTVRTDNNGKAEVSFVAPDNLTTWQFDVAGVSDRLDGGLSSGEVLVTKPIFVDIVMPSDILSTDKPTIKLRAFGVGLTDEEEVTFEVDAPTLGIQKQLFKGKAGRPITFAIENTTVGTHVLTLGVITSKGSDGIQRTLTISDTHARHYELQSIEAAPGTTLPEADAPETAVTFVSHGRGSYLGQVYELAWGDYPRADAVIAQRLANRWLKDYFGRTDGIADDAALQAAFTDYVEYNGAIRLKQYGSTDIELTSEIAATAPELLDKKTVAQSLWASLDNRRSSRSMQMSALAGLAALGEPVIYELDRMSAVEDLTVRERLVLARGMEAAGNREAARFLLEQILGTAVVHDQLLSIEVSENKSENIEATADAAALAMLLADTRAEKLMNYVKTNWSNEAFPVLAKARFVNAGLATAVNRDIQLKYAIGSNEKELVFNDAQSAHELIFTREEMKNIVITSVNGPVDISYVRNVAGNIPSTPGLSIKRTYTHADGISSRPWSEGDRVKITLEASWDKNTQDGCYTVRDYLPANMRAVFSWENYGTYYLTKGTATNADFVVCKTEKPQKIEYTARIFSRGSYTAEAPRMQHLNAPSITTMGNNEIITVE